VQLRDHVALTEVEYGMALLDEKSGEYWNLNPTGSVVLETLLSGGTVEAAVDALAKEYEVDRASLSSDVAGLVGELCSVGLLVR